MSDFAEACAAVGRVLTGDTRQAIVSELASARTLGQALTRLREQMRTHTFHVGGRTINLAGVVGEYDDRTQQDGFHALNDWDGKGLRFNSDIIPVDVLSFLIDQRGATPTERTPIAILLDYYFAYILALLSLRVWDDGQPDAHLDLVDALLADLQGSGGSGQQFAANAETLMLIATSHYEPDDDAYDRLLARSRSLGPVHGLRTAIVHAQSMGSHLRFGFEATYNKNTIDMRDDNGVDYRWLCFALATLMREYARVYVREEQGHAREFLVEAILNGLSADARAFVRDPPKSLAAVEADRAEFDALFRVHRADLLREFDAHRPRDQRYSPIALFYNFAQNVVKGTVADALLWGDAWTVSLNDLWTGVPRDSPRSEAKLRLAATLMRYARSSPDTIRGRLTPVIVYDPPIGRRAFAVTIEAVKGGSAS
jgi:hypothetical protein